jgi:hypothetical protein
MKGDHEICGFFSLSSSDFSAIEWDDVCSKEKRSNAWDDELQ